MRTLITGGTGLLGRELIPRVTEAVLLSRDPNRVGYELGSVKAYAWDPTGGPPPPEALLDVEVVFHLAGEPVADGRWSAERKRRIRDSRVLGTRNLVAGLAAHRQTLPRVLVSASAVGFYGERGDEELDERSVRGDGFLADVCEEWEREAMAAERLGIRVVCVRMGLVLAPGGGALARMLTPFRMGAGGRIGSGQQWMSPIHIEDAVGIFLHASQNHTIRGPINGVGPEPVRNAEFTRALGHAVRRPALLSLPGPALRIAFGEMSRILTDSQRVFPRVAERTGYAFKYPELGAALAAAVKAAAGSAGSAAGAGEGPRDSG